MKLTDKIELLNEDNMQVMARYPDKYFDLAIVDPPYGIGFGKFNRTNTNSEGQRYKANKYKNGDWDSAVPSDEYFIELKRISKEQIVFGGNYFEYLCGVSPKMKTISEFQHFMKNSNQNWIFWHKQNPVPNFADGELAWCSFPTDQIVFNFRYYGGIEGATSASKKIHPTQKPIGLYDWLFRNYAQKDFKVIDTHAGSFNIGISAHYYGCELVACEIDADYHKDSVAMFKQKTRQVDIFAGFDMPAPFSA